MVPFPPVEMNCSHIAKDFHLFSAGALRFQNSHLLEDTLHPVAIGQNGQFDLEMPQR
jgi:hypothetical protein